MKKKNFFTDIPHPVIEIPQKERRQESLQNLSVGGGLKSFKSDQSGIWLGADKFTEAPFRVDMLGNFYSSAVSDIQLGLQTQINTNASAITLEATNRANADGVLQSQISVQAGQINLKVSKNSIISEINISPEAIKISADKITLVGNTEFVSLTNTVNGKINTGGAASDINTNTTTINGGKITTGSITASQIQAGTITTDRLNFTPVTPGTGTNAVNSSGKVTSIDGSSITVSNISADNIVTGVLTGRTVQTSSSGSRIILDGTLNRLRFHKSNGAEVAYMEGVTININGGSTDVVRVLSSSTASFAAQNGIIAGTGFLTTATSLMGHLNPILNATYDLGTGSSFTWRNLRLNGTIFIKGIALSVIGNDLYWNGVKIN